MGPQGSRLSWFENCYQLVGARPSPSDERTSRLDAWEGASGRTLSSSLRELLTTDVAVAGMKGSWRGSFAELLGRYGIVIHPFETILGALAGVEHTGAGGSADPEASDAAAGGSQPANEAADARTLALGDALTLRLESGVDDPVVIGGDAHFSAALTHRLMLNYRRAETPTGDSRDRSPLDRDALNRFERGAWLRSACEPFSRATFQFVMREATGGSVEERFDGARTHVANLRGGVVTMTCDESEEHAAWFFYGADEASLAAPLEYLAELRIAPRTLAAEAPAGEPAHDRAREIALRVLSATLGDRA